MTQPYQVLGDGSATLLGRHIQMQDILARVQDNHVQVIGPKYFGKTVLLNAVVNAPTIRQVFSEVVHWDLASHTPTTDAEFWLTFSQTMQTTFSSARQPYLKNLKEVTEPTYRHFESVFRALQQDKLRVLLVLDGMSSILPTGYVKRALLDNLRDLGQIGSLKFVTGNRKTLREISPAEVKTSPFLNLLNTIVSVGAFADEDWESILQPLKTRGHVPDTNALVELKAVTGGVPILVAALCSELMNLPGASPSHPKSFSRSDVAQLVTRCETSCREQLDELWSDCPAELKATLADIANGRPTPLDQVPLARLEDLQTRGFARATEKNVISSCRLMDNHAKRNKDAVPDIKRLFAGRADYEKNIRPLLELRLAHLAGIDSDLKDYIEMAIRELHRPHVSIAQLRSVADRALDLIWNCEGDNGQIPTVWARNWMGDASRNPFVGAIPSDRGDQIFVLDRATDDRRAVPVRKITRCIFLLLSQVHGAGNLGQHQKSATRGQIDLGFMAAQCFTAIQLAEQLSAALKSLPNTK